MVDTNSIRVLPAEISDLRSLYMLTCDMLGESPEYSQFDPDPVRIVANLERYVEDNDRCAFVAILGQEVIGFMLGYMYPMEMIDGYAAADTGLYVQRLWRNEGVGQKLLRAYKEWAQVQGVTGPIQFGSTTRIDDVAVQCMAEKEGFQSVGHLMRKM